MQNVSTLQTQIDIVDNPHGVQLVLEAEGTLAAAVTEIEDIVEALVAAANFGMLSIAPTTRGKSLEIKTVDNPTDNMVRYVLTATGLQVGAYKVLLNQVEVAHRLSGLLTTFRLVETSGRGQRLNRSDVENAPFPRRAPRLPFTFRAEGNLFNNRQPVIRFNFKRDISDGELDLLTPGFRAWDNLVVRGGFLEDFTDVVDDVDVAAGLSSTLTYMAGGSTVEHVLYDFIGVEAAFDAIINMAHRMNQVLYPLESVEIE